MDPLTLFLTLLKASALSVGGISSLPLLRQDLVLPGFATDTQIVESLAIGRLSPGPNGLFVVALGYLMNGWLGGVIAAVAICLPPLLLIPALALGRRWIVSRVFTGVVRGVTLGTSGLLISVALFIVAPRLPQGVLPDLRWWQALLVLAGTVLVIRTKLHPAALVGGGAVVGIAMSRLG